jgi:TetR/AcrR family transcriptional regulator, copper-responsive repressor
MSPKTKRQRGRPRTFDRAKALQLVLQSYWEHGLHRLSLNEACRLSGISKPTLYREFGGEDELIAAALELYRHQRVLPLLERLREEQPLAQAIEEAIVELTTDDGTPPGCLFTKMRLSTSRLGPIAKNAVKALRIEQRAAFEDWFRRGLKRGDANPKLTPAAAARYFDTQLATILVQTGEGVPPDEIREQARLALSVLTAPT